MFYLKNIRLCFMLQSHNSITKTLYLFYISIARLGHQMVLDRPGLHKHRCCCKEIYKFNQTAQKIIQSGQIHGGQPRSESLIQYPTKSNVFY